MGEELIESATEEIVDVEHEEAEESIVSEEDFTQSVDIEDEDLSVEVDSMEEIEIAVDEAVGWSGGDNTRHYSLSGRDEPNQHPISAITWLRDELNEIESLKTVYSNKIGIANYYEWYDGKHDEFGYFVSLVPHTSKITICDGADIFGVTVNSAGFVGGQDEVITESSDGTAPKHTFTRDTSYALVATSGLVEVRCESNVIEGDNVISNVYGVAEKTNSGYGYKVVAQENRAGICYATIALGVQACTTDAMGKQIQNLDKRVDNAEINIGTAMAAANEAYKKASDSISSGKVMSSQIQDAMNKVDNMTFDISNIDDRVSDIAYIAAQARAIAENAATSAETAMNEAVVNANEALNKVSEIEKTVEPISNWTYTDPVTGETNTGATYFAEYVQNGLSTKAEIETVNKLDKDNKLLIEKNAENYTRLLSTVDKYTIGEHSQADGLTAQQAINILKEGMVYIPLQCDGMDTHTEIYADGDNTIQRIFTYGFYYVWSGDGLWSENGTGRVWFDETQPAGDAYTYWYDGDKLYLLNDGAWIEVATLAGNVNNRITSMIRQDVDRITAEVVNARGSGSSLSVRLSDTDATIASNAFWKNDDGSKYVATFQQNASGDGSSLALIAHRIDTNDGTEQDKSVELKGASVVLGQNGADSYINIDAKNIVLNGDVAFTKEENGETKINGANIATGTISADAIDATYLSVDAANIYGYLTASQIDATDLHVDAANIDGTLTIGVLPDTVAEKSDIPSEETITTITNNTIQTTNVKAENLQVNAVNIDGKLTADQINADGITANNVTLSGDITATSGQLGDMTITGTLSFGGDSSYYISANYNDTGYYINLPGLKIDNASKAVFSGELSSPSGSIGGCEIVDGVLKVPATCISTQLSASQINADGITAKDVSLTGSFISTLGSDGYTVFIDSGTITLANAYEGSTNKQYLSSSWTDFTSTDNTNGFYLGLGLSGMNSAYVGSGSTGITFSINSSGSEQAELVGTWIGTSSQAITSDATRKHSISEISEKYNAFFDLLSPSIYKYNDGTSDRVHTGFIADQVYEALTSAEITSQEFAGYVVAHTINSETGTEEELKCLRYDEFISLNTWQIQKLKARVSELEQQIALLSN